MLKSIKNTMKLDREKVKIPHRVQDSIPVKAVYEDGVFQVAKNKYSKSWKFTDINYDVLSDEERIETIKNYAFAVNEVLKAFWAECGVTLVIHWIGGEDIVIDTPITDETIWVFSFYTLLQLLAK